MFNKILKLSFLFSFLTFSLFAKDLNEIYFLPKQSQEVKEKIISLINESKSSISISMYNFSYKKFVKHLVKAKKKKNIKITVILDKSKVQKDDEVYKILKKNHINVYIPSKKLHTKLALFDEKILLLGSSNWTKKSFEDNYEVVLVSKNKKIIKKTKKFLDSLQ